MNKLKIITVGSLDVNCYVLSSGQDALIIDPGAEASIIKSYLDKEKLTAKFIVHTHGHFDHIGADGEFNLPVYIHQSDKDALKDPNKNLSFIAGDSFEIHSELVILEDGDEVKLNDITLKVIHTPGHTKGGICLLWEKEKCIFTGDTLFCQGVGRTDFPGASHKELIDSIKKKLLVLSDSFVCYPGHGPKTTIGYEKKNNSFLKG